MAPVLMALLPQLMGMLQKKQPAQGPGYNQTPPEPEDSMQDSRKAVLGKLQMPTPSGVTEYMDKNKGQRDYNPDDPRLDYKLQSPKLADQDLYDTLDYPG